jgi:hypothetical protein
MLASCVRGIACVHAQQLSDAGCDACFVAAAAVRGARMRPIS